MASVPEPVYTSPRTDAHLRDVLSRLASTIGSITIDITDLENTLLREATFNDTVVSGDLLYAPSSGTVALAQANAAATARVIGIAVAAVNGTETGLYLVVGSMQKTGWGLTAGATYYLSPTAAGQMSTTMPTTVGHYIVQVGRALETEKFSFAGPQLSILL